MSSKFSFTVAAALVAGGALLSACALTPPATLENAVAWLRPAVVPAPVDNQPTAVRIELGKQLFFDPRLSGSNAMSCASCHNPSLGWSDGLPTAMGDGAKRLGRNTPTVINTAYNPIQMWDGRKRTLEDQATGPIEAADEMNQNIDALVGKLSALEGYRAAFEQAYPGEGITKKTIAKAIASYERTVVSSESPFDRWVRGDRKAIGEPAQRGFAVFNGKGNCAKCHMGFNFTDNGFHNIGVKSTFPGDEVGRFAHLRLPSMKGAYKTPTLRDIDRTAPYMRNGVYRTLEEVVEHYDRGGDVRQHLSPNIQALNLTAQEKSDLVAFMKTLTGTPQQVTLPQLPN